MGRGKYDPDIDGKKPRRTFLGRIPVGGTKLTNLEKKEFKAYVRGFRHFITGYTLTHDGRKQPNYARVRVAYK